MKRFGFFAAALAAMVFLSAGPVLAQDTYKINPVTGSSDIKAFSSQGWLTMQGLPSKDHYLFKIAYLRGFLDAVQFAEVAPGKTTQILDDLEGLDLKQLVDDIDKFYQDYPQYQAYSPAVVMLVILPRIKEGKPPIPEVTEEEKKDENFNSADLVTEESGNKAKDGDSKDKGQ